LGNPELAFEFAQIPNDGVGLARLEFIINNHIGVHPKAILDYPNLDSELKSAVESCARGYANPREFFVQRLAEGVRQTQAQERHAGRTQLGPHRDQVRLELDGQDAAQSASSGQARSLLLALVLASLQVYREESGTAAVALLDDLDSELDAERALAVCRAVAAKGQALVTTAHPGWAERLGGAARVYRVEAGSVLAA